MVDGVQSAGDGGMALRTEGAEQVGHRLAVLPDGQAGKIDAGRMVAGAGFGRVELAMDVGGDGGGIGFAQGAGVVLGHLADDVSRQGGRGLLAEKGFVGLAGHALAHGPVAGPAVLLVDRLTSTGRAVLALIGPVGRRGGDQDGRGDGRPESDLDGT